MTHAKPVRVHAYGTWHGKDPVADYEMDDGSIRCLSAVEAGQLRCDHVWQHESIIQPGGRGYSTSWCRKCKVTDFGLRKLTERPAA